MKPRTCGERQSACPRNFGLRKPAGVFCVLCGLIIGSLFASTTTFVNVPSSYYGRQAVINKLIVTVTPEVNDINSVSSTAVSTDSYFGILDRITFAAVGDDNDFTVTVKDETLSLFEKADCNTVTLPLTYAVTMAGADGNNYCGVPVADTLTVDTNDVDPNNLTSIIITLYYRNWRY